MRARPAVARGVPRQHAARVTSERSGVVTWAPAHTRPAASHRKPSPMAVEFFVAAALCVRKVNPLNAATAEKWQGNPTLRKRMG